MSSFLADGTQIVGAIRRVLFIVGRDGVARVDRIFESTGQSDRPTQEVEPVSSVVGKTEVHIEKNELRSVQFE